MKQQESPFGQEVQNKKRTFMYLNHKFYTFKEIRDYLVQYRFTPSFRRGIKDAFYNARTDLNLLIPFDKDDFTKKEIILLFKESNATELPPKIEWCRFQLFIYSQTNTITL